MLILSLLVFKILRPRIDLENFFRCHLSAVFADSAIDNERKALLRLLSIKGDIVQNIRFGIGFGMKFFKTSILAVRKSKFYIIMRDFIWFYESHREILCVFLVQIVTCSIACSVGSLSLAWLSLMISRKQLLVL